MIINLFTVRFVLKGLGVDDYGIYDVVAGVVSMFAVFSSVLSTAVQRFYSYALGENDLHKLQRIFVISFRIFIIVSFVILLLSETGGLWFVNVHLQIPNDRLIAANYVYQFAIFSLVLVLIEVPYSAAVIAHEDMGVFAIISTLECFLKLLVALCLIYSSFDHLIFYGLNLFIVKIVITLIYFYISKKRYKECVYINLKDRKLTRELLSFSGWIIFSSLAALAINQISAILINLFFGPSVNGSRAISIQVSSALASFVGAFFIAVNPPIVKSYAEKNYAYVLKLFNVSNKFCYYALLMFLVPLFFEMDILLKLWLNVSDSDTIEFSRLMVVYTFVLALNNPISIVMRAAGYLKEYHVPVECIMMLTAPVTYFAFKLGCNPISSSYILILITMIAHLERIIILRKYFREFRVQEYFLNFLFPAIFVTLIVVFLSYCVHFIIGEPIIRFLLNFIVAILTTIFLLRYVVLSKEERQMIFSFLREKLVNKIR